MTTPATPPKPVMTVGDLNSTAPGSAARASAGKAPLDLIDLRVLADSLPRETKTRKQVLDVLVLLGDFQMTGTSEALDDALGAAMDLTTPEEVAAVLEFGKRKYAAWNWSKGFKWSVPIGCAARHLLAVHRGQMHDTESGLPHYAHVWCNLMMLSTFIRDYPDGNDLPWHVNAQVAE